MEFKEKLKEMKAAEEAEKAQLENSESTNKNEASELQSSNGEVTEEVTANGEQTQEATDANAESQSAETNACEKSDHSNMNGQIESHLHNGNCATKNESEEEEQQSNTTNGVSTESQSKSSNVLMSVLLAVYLLAGGETALAQRCLYRAKVLLLAVHGADHPYTAVIDASLGLVLQGEQALQYLQSALKLNSSFRGDADLTTALMHHLLAQRQCVAGDYRGGMNHEKEAHSIFQSKYGEDHPQTKCSSDFLRNITQQAVRVERSIRQGGAELCDTPPEGLVPSQDTTLEQLALVNGILKTSYSTRMMEFKEKLKEMKAAEEAEKAQLENSESTNKNEASELQSSNGEVTEEVTANGEQTQEATDANAESQSAETNACEKSDHSNMNGQIESHLHNGNCATKNESEEEEQQSNTTNGVSTESQSKSSNVLMSVNEAQSESAVVNGKECVVKDDSEKQVETE
ncbi:protein clueless-like [Sinocyclocheilus anshuiensis]|uniref:protein clueless-like n=1 Tax=Sinocyclocheilus anshuiensis TaxID=1608454 RepID=UPI0007B93933|nr:PREDICTED: protein clueless-like [Sinocyclocheilus anshuiensis]